MASRIDRDVARLQETLERRKRLLLRARREGREGRRAAVVNVVPGEPAAPRCDDPPIVFVDLARPPVGRPTGPRYIGDAVERRVEEEEEVVVEEEVDVEEEEVVVVEEEEEEEEEEEVLSSGSVAAEESSSSADVEIRVPRRRVVKKVPAVVARSTPSRIAADMQRPESFGMPRAASPWLAHAQRVRSKQPVGELARREAAAAQERDAVRRAADADAAYRAERRARRQQRHAARETSRWFGYARVEDIDLSRQEAPLARPAEAPARLVTREERLAAFRKRMQSFPTTT